VFGIESDISFLSVLMMLILFCEMVSILKKNAEAVLGASKGVGLE
jgi:hypothetical protein